MRRNHVTWIEVFRRFFYFRLRSSTGLVSRVLGFEPLELRLALTGSAVQTADDSVEILAADASDDFRLLPSSGLVYSASRPASHVAYSHQEAVPDFALMDLNSTSPTYNQSVSPRDYVGEVSAWYFGHAT